MGQKIYSWMEQKMMNPNGKIGVVTKENITRRKRELTVSFPDKTEDSLILSLVGRNPIDSQKWKWKHEKLNKWVEWGE